MMLCMQTPVQLYLLMACAREHPQTPSVLLHPVADYTQGTVPPPTLKGSALHLYKFVENTLKPPKPKAGAQTKLSWSGAPPISSLGQSTSDHLA